MEKIHLGEEEDSRSVGSLIGKYCCDVVRRSGLVEKMGVSGDGTGGEEDRQQECTVLWCRFINL